MKNKIPRLIIILFIINVFLTVLNIVVCTGVKNKLDRAERETAQILEILDMWELDEY